MKGTICIFFSRRDVRKLTCLTAKFQKDPIEPLREIAWSVLFPLSIKSSKFSTEVLHTKFELQCFVKEMFN